MTSKRYQQTEAFPLLNIFPTYQKWRIFLMELLLWIGGLAIAFSGLFFIAYNWDELGHFSKFAMVEITIILSVLAYWKLGTEKTSAKVALFMAIIFLGVLLALFGQTYQTGADPWQLFFYWALLILPWAMIGRFAAIWIFALSLLNLSIILYYQAHGHIIWILFGYRSQILWPLFIFNSAALLCWEFISINKSYLQEQWATRLIATASGVVITWLIIQSIFHDPSLNVIPYLIWALWMAAMYWMYRKVKVELFMLAGLCLSATVVIVMSLGKAMLSDANPGSFLFLALLIIALGTSSAIWLRNIHREALEEAGLEDGEAPERNNIESPWYVKTLLAFSGWLASLFMLGFVVMAFQAIFDHSLVMLVLGILMIVGAYVLLNKAKNEFVEHLTLSISLAGQVLLVFALFDIVEQKDDMAWFLIALFQIPLALFMPNYLHRFFSSFAAAICLSLAVAPLGLAYILNALFMLLCSWIWLNEFKYPKHIKTLQAIGYGLTLGIMELKRSVLFNGSANWLGSSRVHHEIWALPWVGELMLGAVLLFITWQLLKRYDYHHLSKGTIFAGISIIILTALSTQAHGILVGIIILVLGFSASNKVLQGLGIFALLSYISVYYYFQQSSLLDKSQTLIILGIALLCIRWLYLNVIAKATEVKDES